jgi:hypothetical protein
MPIPKKRAWFERSYSAIAPNDHSFLPDQSFST